MALFLPSSVSLSYFILVRGRVDDLKKFYCSSPFCFLLIKFHCTFSISSIVLTCYVYYYCIRLSFNTLFSCFFAGLRLFFPKGSVTGCDSSLGSFCYSPVYFLSRTHLHFGYYYYHFVVIGMLRPLRLK